MDDKIKQIAEFSDPVILSREQWNDMRQQIQIMREALVILDEIKAWDIKQWKRKGAFTLPLKLRARMAKQKNDMSVET
jgi:hypothetical protein